MTMRLKPDFTRTATGYVWLDQLLVPFYRLWSWWNIRRFDRLFKITGTKEERRAKRRDVILALVALKRENNGELP